MEEIIIDNSGYSFVLEDNLFASMHVAGGLKCTILPETFLPATSNSIVKVGGWEFGWLDYVNGVLYANSGQWELFCCVLPESKLILAVTCSKGPNHQKSGLLVNHVFKFEDIVVIRLRNGMSYAYDYDGKALFSAKHFACHNTFYSGVVQDEYFPQGIVILYEKGTHKRHFLDARIQGFLPTDRMQTCGDYAQIDDCDNSYLVDYQGHIFAKGKKGKFFYQEIAGKMYLLNTGTVYENDFAEFFDPLTGCNLLNIGSPRILIDGSSSWYRYDDRIILNEDCVHVVYRLINGEEYVGLVDSRLNFKVMPSFNRIQKLYRIDLYQVWLHNHSGVINEEGKFIVPAIYRRIDCMYNRFIIASNNGKSYLYTINGDLVFVRGRHSFDDIEIEEKEFGQLYELHLGAPDYGRAIINDKGIEVILER